MTDKKFNTPFTDPLRRSLPQRPFAMGPISFLNDDLDNSPVEENHFPKSADDARNIRCRSTTSPAGLNYSDNLYCLLEGGVHPRKRLSRNTWGAFNPILESLAGMQKMLITKQVLLAYQRDMGRDVRFCLQNADENLDGDDPFQCERFSLWADNPKVMEFKLGDLEELKLEEGHTHFCGKFTDAVEHYFHDKMFTITLTEQRRTKIIGTVRRINGAYHAYDQHEMEVFQVERISEGKPGHRIAIVKKGEDGEIEREIGSIDLGNWNTMTLEAEVSYDGICTAKEKLLILGTVLAIMMKIEPGHRVPRRDMHGACSVGGLWKEMLDKMKSLFQL